MKLSEYIKRLQKIARAQRRKGQDPDVCLSRCSDLTTDIGASDDPHPFPRVIRALPVPGADWIIKANPTMSDAQQALVKDYVEIGHGN